MATKLYVTAAAAPVTPAESVYDAAGTETWELPSSAPAVSLLAYSSNWPGASTFSTVTVSKDDTTADNDRGIRNFISDALSGAQTITGTMRGQMLMNESVSTVNAHPQIMAKVVSNDGQTLRGVLYGGDTRTGTVDELGTTLRNYPNPGASIDPVTLSSVSAQDEDRIVIEVGFRNNNTNAGHTVSLRFGSLAGVGGANDLTVDGTETTDLNGWVEFSQDLTFVAGAPPAGTDLIGMVGI